MQQLSVVPDDETIDARRPALEPGRGEPLPDDRPAVPGTPDVVVSPVEEFLASLVEEYRTLDEGEVATYIPELGRADPAWFGVAIVTVDGHVITAGDAEVPFSIQSISKPFVFGMALEDNGPDAVAAHVGVEPSGNAFNAIVVDGSNRPYNPMVNAGAIVTTGLVRGDDDRAASERLFAAFARYAGRELKVDEAVYESERATGDRNRAIAYLMRSFDMLETDVDATLDLYFRQCALEVDCRDVAMMAATLANRGVNPRTGERALDERYVQNVLSVMNTCGLYDYAGKWAYTIGLPAKSGVAGGVVAILPGQFGVCVFSPRLDARGNSVRGIKVCERLAEEFSLHPLRFQPVVAAVVRRTYDCVEARSNRLRTTAEYDFLARHGATTVVYELQGDLFFGSMELAYRRVVGALEGVERVVLDFKRVTALDGAARAMLDHLQVALERSGRTLVVSHGAAGGARTFPDTDRAIEWCEDRLLQRDGFDAVAPPPLLSAQDLLEGLTPDELAALEAVTVVTTVPAGRMIFHQGDQADSMFFLLAGSVSVRLPSRGRVRGRRLATLAAGVAFGEMAMLDEGTRSADVAADEPSTLAELSTTALASVAEGFPDVTTRIYRNLARNLSRRVRTANEQVRALEQ